MAKELERVTEEALASDRLPATLTGVEKVRSRNRRNVNK